MATAYCQNDFYPRPPRGGRLCCRVCNQKAIRISIHALREEGDVHKRTPWTVRRYFYPRPPRGGRPVRSDHQPPAGQFLSTPSARRATFRRTAIRSIWLFLSTPSARRATEGYRGHPQHRQISIHALREEGDGTVLLGATLWYHFYPRPPRGGRPGADDAWSQIEKFLSTPSARRAT